MKPKTAPEKAPSPPRAVHQVKSSLRRSGGMAEGGSGPTKKTFGTGTRTVAASGDAAVPAKGGASGKPVTASGANTAAAEGGPPVRSPSFGGLARPAKGGQTGAA
jgi:hypothetical protein